MFSATLKLPCFTARRLCASHCGFSGRFMPRLRHPSRRVGPCATIASPMPAISAQLVDALASVNDSLRADAAAQIYNIGVAPALRIAQKWQQNPELEELLATPQLHITVGLAVSPATFAQIRAAAGNPAL